MAQRAKHACIERQDLDKWPVISVAFVAGCRLAGAPSKMGKASTRRRTPHRPPKPLAASHLRPLHFKINDRTVEGDVNERCKSSSTRGSICSPVTQATLVHALGTFRNRLAPLAPFCSRRGGLGKRGGYRDPGESRAHASETPPRIQTVERLRLRNTTWHPVSCANRGPPFL